MSNRPVSSYDELPYSCHPVHHAHPDNLACKAILYGLRAPAIRSCRVLELGCGSGANLLPLAQIFPEAKFVGLDYSERQILEGRAIAETVGLKNLDLRALSFADVDDRLEEFDYIICHGVYSWVSASLQESILEIIQRHLAPDGVAYISYNTFPGWHLRGLVREILCYQTAGGGTPSDQVSKARKYLDFLIENAPDQEGIYGRILRREKDILSKTPDTYLFHEHLEELNQPLYFHEFAKRLAAHDLQYLCEASFHHEEENFSEELREQLRQNSRDRIDYEQQVDFLCNGTFRRSLLCRAKVSISSQPSTLALRQLRVRSRARPTRPIIDAGSDQAEEFVGSRGETVTTSHPLIKAALLCLSEAWPRSMTLEELQAKTNVKLNRRPDPVQQLQDTELLSKALLRCHRTDIVHLATQETPCVFEVSERPVVAPLSRWQAANEGMVTNLTHEIVDLNDFDRLVVTLLDGESDRASLCQAVIDQVTQGKMALQHQGKPVEDRELIAKVVEQSLSNTFRKLVDLNMLVG